MSKDHDIPSENSIMNFICGHHGFVMPGDTPKNKTQRFELIEKGYTRITDFKDENLYYPQQKFSLNPF